MIIDKEFYSGWQSWTAQLPGGDQLYPTPVEPNNNWYYPNPCYPHPGVVPPPLTTSSPTNQQGLLANIDQIMSFRGIGNVALGVTLPESFYTKYIDGEIIMILKPRGRSSK